MIHLPAVPVAVTDAPPGQPVTVWMDTGSGGGLELTVPADQRRRLPRRGDRDVLLLMPEPEDVEALHVLANAQAIWNSYDAEEQDPL